jgi:hypothetical protein
MTIGSDLPINNDIMIKLNNLFMFNEFYNEPNNLGLFDLILSNINYNDHLGLNHTVEFIEWFNVDGYVWRNESGVDNIGLVKLYYLSLN